MRALDKHTQAAAKAQGSGHYHYGPRESRNARTSVGNKIKQKYITCCTLHMDRTQRVVPSIPSLHYAPVCQDSTQKHD